MKKKVVNKVEEAQCDRLLGFVLRGPCEQERSCTHATSSAAPTEANHREGSKGQICGRVTSLGDLEPHSFKQNEILFKN